MYEYTEGARIDTLGRPRARATPRRLRRASSSLDMRAATTLNAPAITLRVARARRPATTPRSSSTNARARANVSTERASSVRANSRAEDAENDASSSMSGELDAADEFAFEPRSKSKRKRDTSTTRRAKVDVLSLIHI